MPRQLADAFNCLGCDHTMYEAQHLLLFLSHTSLRLILFAALLRISETLMIRYGATLIKERRMVNYMNTITPLFSLSPLHI